VIRELRELGRLLLRSLSDGTGPETGGRRLTLVVGRRAASQLAGYASSAGDGSRHESLSPPSADTSHDLDPAA
jgi:hypothetical protein